MSWGGDGGGSNCDGVGGWVVVVVVMEVMVVEAVVSAVNSG